MDSLATTQESNKIINAMVGLGHGLGLTVGADGVGNVDQGASLRDTGCEEAQGVVFGGPIPVERTLALFSRVQGEECQNGIPDVLSEGSVSLKELVK